MRNASFYVVTTVLYFLILVASASYGEEETATDFSVSASAETASQDKFFQWAWEIPDPDFTKYPVAQYSYWTPVSAAVGGGFRYLNFRDRDNFDENHWGGYLFFRPMVLKFADSFLSVGAYGNFDAFYLEGKEAFPISFEVNGIVSASDSPNATLTSRAIPFALGVSLLWSSPASGLQMSLEVGHFWSSTKFRASKLLLPNPVPDIDPTIGPFPGRGRREQEESGIDIFYNFTLLSDRSYLAGISLNLISTYRTGPVDVNAKLIYPETISLSDGTIIPIGAQRVPSTVIRSNFILSVVYVKALAIPLEGNLPFASKHDVLSIEPAGGIGHFDEDDGNFVGLGFRISLGDMVGFSYFHTWEQKNQRADGDLILVEIGFQQGVGRKSLPSK